MASTPRRRVKRQFANQDLSSDVEMRIGDSDDPKAEGECADWLLQIELAERRNEKWDKRCKRILKRYRAERGDDDTNMTVPQGMNIFWSNVQTLQPSIYGREPVPIAERRFLDRDVTGRVASQILERAMRYEMGDCGFHDTVTQAVFDYCTVGRGVAWLRYKPIIGPATSLADLGDDELSDRLGDPANDDAAHPEMDTEAESDDRTSEVDSASSGDKLLFATTDVDYVHWRDFFHSKARFWKENEWVSRRLYLSRKDCVDSFGKERGNEIPLEMEADEDESQRASGVGRSSDNLKKAVVFEIWHKPTRKVYTVAKGYHRFCEEPREDPLNLEGFWPCPKPLFATMTNDTLQPVPDYLEYQDQALEIDNITKRINALIKALRVAGVYDSSQKELARILDDGGDNKLIPVPSWAAFAQKGGLPAAISFVPIKEVSDVLLGLFKARDQIKQDLYEITGLSDIIRGQADPRETAEAVKTKGRWGSLRLQSRQAEVARFCRDIIRMMGEIIAEHYPVETLINISGAMYDEGIGGPAPVAPKPPQMGHNGGPPTAVVNMAGMAQSAPSRSMAMPPAGQPQIQSGFGSASHPDAANRMGAADRQQSIMQGQSTPAIDPMAQYAMQMQQYQQQMQAHQFEKSALIMRAIDLLKQDKMRGFRIDIETDSTIQNDANDDKAARTQFLASTTQFIEESFKIGMQNPDAVPMLGKFLLFGVRGFRAGRDLESSIEEFIDKSEKDAVARQNMPAAPNPDVQKGQLELEAVKAKSAAEVQKAETDAQSSAADNQREIASKNLDAELARQQMAMDMEKMQQEKAMRDEEFSQKMAALRMQMAFMEREHEQRLEQSNIAHRQAIERLTMPPANRPD